MKMNFSGVAGDCDRPPFRARTQQTVRFGRNMAEGEVYYNTYNIFVKYREQREGK